MYQLISLGLNVESYSLDQLIRRTNRIRVASDLVTDVWRYVDRGYPRVLLDNFIHYLLNFYYSTQKLWKDRAEDLGDFPFDVIDRLQKMMKLIAGKSNKRRQSKFATDLETAQEIISSIEKKYRNEVKKHAAQGRHLFNQGGSLDVINEEEGGEDDEVGDEEDDEE